MPEINRWWETDHNEIYWLEITNRSDIGADLHIPQGNTSGYRLINHISLNDIVLHYDKNKASIVGYSRATGEVFERETLWAASRSKTPPKWQPGWYMPIEDYTLIEPISYRTLMDSMPLIESELEKIRSYSNGAYYPPFAFAKETSFKWPDRMRISQTYIAKFPYRLIPVIPELNLIFDQGHELGRTNTPRFSRTVQPDLERRQLIELQAQTAVIEMYMDRGYEVKDVSAMNYGWDIEAYSQNEKLMVEVKGRSIGITAAELTPNEYINMINKITDFRLCIVTDALDSNRISIHEFTLNDSGQWADQFGNILDIMERVSARVRSD